MGSWGSVYEQDSGLWPALHHDDWSDTCATLHLWTQVVGCHHDDYKAGNTVE
jgi:Family of unknown function (DUF5996)